MRHFTQGRFRATGEFSATSISPGRQFAVQQCPLGRTRYPSTHSGRRCWKDRIFTPLVTLWVFLSQVLSADHSCRAAVARLIAHRFRGDKVHAPQKPAPIARRASVCPKSSSPTWLVRSVVRWTPKPINGGCGKGGASTCLMARPSPCPTPQRIKKLIRKFTIRNRASAFPLRESAPSFSCVAGPF